MCLFLSKISSIEMRICTVWLDCQQTFTKSPTWSFVLVFLPSHDTVIFHRSGGKMSFRRAVDHPKIKGFFWSNSLCHFEA